MKEMLAFNDYLLFFTTDRYQDGNTAIEVWCVDDEDGSKEPYYRLTTNIIPLGNEKLATLDENNDFARLIPYLAKRGLISAMGFSIPSGFCSYPVYDISKLLEYIVNEQEDIA